MATIRKRSGRWHVQVRRKGHKPQTKSFELKTEADKWARRVEREIDRGDLPHTGDGCLGVTLGTLIDRYLVEVTPAKRSAAKERYRLRRIATQDFAFLPIAELGAAPIAKFRDERLKHVQSQAVRHDLNIIGHVIRIAMREWDLPLLRNPVTDLRKPPPSKSRERRLEPGEYDEIRSVAVKSDTGSRLMPVVDLALETAMRKSELIRLAWPYVNLENATALIHETKNGYERTIPLTPGAEDLLVSLWTGTAGPVFDVTAPWLRFAWDLVVARAGIADLHFHDLRHESISRFFEKGLTLPEVALISGHKDPRQLMNYTHLRPEQVALKLG